VRLTTKLDKQLTRLNIKAGSKLTVTG